MNILFIERNVSTENATRKVYGIKASVFKTFQECPTLWQNNQVSTCYATDLGKCIKQMYTAHD